MNIKNLLDHTRLLKFGNGLDRGHSDYPIKGYLVLRKVVTLYYRRKNLLPSTTSTNSLPRYLWVSNFKLSI